MVKAKELKLLRKRLQKAEKLVPKENYEPITKLAPPSDLTIVSPARLTDDQQDDCLQLFEHNMGEMYRHSAWGLDLEDKRSELTHRKARVVLLYETTNLAAFCHFRICWDDDEVPTQVVVYVYELQINSAFQRRGLGTYMMQQVVEPVCLAAQVTWVQLTVFAKNMDAQRFYKRLGYSIDESSPCQHGEVADYQIWSKRIVVDD